MPDGKIEIFNGKLVSPFEFIPELDFDVESVAHSIACSSRYNGHTCKPWYIGAHCLLVMQMLLDDGWGEIFQLAGLLHDSGESIIGDIVTPFKYRPEMKFFRELDHKIDNDIMVYHDINYHESREDLSGKSIYNIVKEQDCYALSTEAYFLHKPNSAWAKIFFDYPPKVEYKEFIDERSDWLEIKDEWLNTYYTLVEKLKNA